MTEWTQQEVLDRALKAEEYEEMLREARRLLKMALWVNWVLRKEADELCDEIRKAVGECH